MPNTVDHADLSALLRLQPLDGGQLRSTRNVRNLNNRIYGGQILGQLLTAAAQTVDSDRAPSMLQMTFLHGARADADVDYQVVHLQDGRRFSTRRVGARQSGKPVADSHVSFQVPAQGPEHQLDPAAFPLPPQGSADPADQPPLLHDLLQRAGYPDLLPHPLIDFRFIDPADPSVKAGEFHYWQRVSHPLADDAMLHAAALAYLSDWWLNFVSLALFLPKPGEPQIYMASLNHALWFHQPCRSDRWLYCVARSSHVGNARSLSTVEIYDESRRHVASVAQQALQARRTD